MSKQDDVKLVKIQTYVLKVNIHCEGCKQKVKKLLQKIEGVYTSTIDAEQGKVTVSGNVDPSILIKKLQKNGKHAELWGSKGDKNKNTNQSQKMQTEQGKGQKDGKPQKGEKEQKGKNQLPQPQQQWSLQLPQLKGMQDLNLPQFNGLNLGMKGPKHVQFSVPDDEDDLGSEDFGDEYDDDDDFDDGFDGEDLELMKMKPTMLANGMMMGNVPSPKAMDGKKGGGNGGGNGKKGGGTDVNVQQQNKGGGNDAKNGNGGKKGGGNNGGNQNQGGGGAPKNGGNGGGGNNKNANGAGGGGGHNNGAPGKKGGGGVPINNMGQPLDMGQVLRDINLPAGVNLAQMSRMNPMGHMGGQMGHQLGHMGGQMGHQLGQMGNIPAPGLPTGQPAMNPNAYFQGAGPEIIAGNPYHQQQYVAAMMAQQRLNGDERFHPMMYNRPPPAVAYYPPQPPSPAYNYNSYFSDENPSGCSVM